MQSRPQQLALPTAQLAPREQRTRPVTTRQTKIRGPTLARVVIQDSSKPSRIAMVKPGEGEDYAERCGGRLLLRQYGCACKAAEGTLTDAGR